MTNKILVLGNFGGKTGQLDGQTVKTLTLFESLCGQPGVRVEKLDVTFYGILSVFPLLKKLVGVSHVILLPGIKQLIVLSPFLFLLRGAFGYKVHYIVIGGWITGKLNNPFIRGLVRRFDSIGCELESMRGILSPENKNTCVLPNYRIEKEEEKLVSAMERNDGIRLVYFSRVMREKGIFEAIDVAEKAREKGKNITLDVYGQLCFLSAEDVALFRKRVEEDSAFVRYKGELFPDKIKGALSAYDVLVFPTRYSGEGFPGCLVDAMRSGLAIICSDWKYNSEIARQNTCVRLVEGDFVPSAVEIVADFMKNPESLSVAKACSLTSAKNYNQSVFDAWYNQWIGSES